MPVPSIALEALAVQMMHMYEGAEYKLLAKVAGRLKRGIDYDGWAEKKLAETSQIRKELAEIVHDLSRERAENIGEYVRMSYLSGVEESKKDIKRIIGSLKSATPNTQKAAAIMAETNTLLRQADRTILRKAGDMYTTVIGRAAADVASGHTTLRQAVQSALNDFAQRGITSFVDKGGSNWEMSTYAEMATITAVTNATVEGYIDTMKENGFDLAIISSHAGACPLCVAWEDVIVSVSGNSDDYPSLDDAISEGLFHPRCAHHISTYYEGVTMPGRSSPRPVEPPSAEYTDRSRQRYMERQIRMWKRRVIASVDAEAERYAFNHVRKWQAALRDHLHNSSSYLPRKYSREGGKIKLSSEALRLR